MASHHPLPHAHDVHDQRRVRTAVVTVSDTRTIMDDEGGALAIKSLDDAGFSVVLREVVRDDRPAIEGAIRAAIAAHVDVVVTTGGTGIAARDVTYEAVSAMLDKTLDGFGEAFRRLSWDQVGARSILSRAVAGVVGDVLVVALPGSPKAVKLAMEQLVVPMLPHAVGMLRPA